MLRSGANSSTVKGRVRNPGGAFSFFASGPYAWRMAFFVGTTSVALVLLLIFLARHEPHARLSPLALGAIMGGALGNLLDRLIHGEVIDPEGQRNSEVRA